MEDTEAQLDTSLGPPEEPKSAKGKPRRHWLFWFLILALTFGISLGIAWWQMSKEDEKAEPVVTNLVADSWRIASDKAAVPRTEVAAALHQGKVYVIGGFDGANQASSAVEIFNPSDESWSAGPELPLAVHHASAVSFNGQLYVIGGLTGSNFVPTAKVYMYDGTIWTEGPSLPEAIGAAGAVVMKGRIYLVGGHDSTNTSSPRLYSLGRDDTVWRTEPPMTFARNHLAVAALDDKLYAIAGRNEKTNLLTMVEVYNPVTHIWTKAPDLPTGRSGITAAVLDGKIYVFGGESNEKTFNENEVFDPETQAWATSLPMPEARHGLGSVALGKRIYIMLGGPQPGYSTSDTVEVLEFSAR